MFVLNGYTGFEAEVLTPPVIHAINMLKRDLRKKFSRKLRVFNVVRLKHDPSVETEAFVMDVGDDITIKAKDDLGFVYGLLYISEHFLGIKPFWFWLDQDIAKVDSVEVEPGQYASPRAVVKYRGWFFNDEVLMMKWSVKGDSLEPWRMAFEALLRCGGNMAIPGTDKNALKYRSLAADMGLWITHHHAEPLGAEMFARAYPEIDPNYSEQKERFWKLWEDAVKEQSEYKVIWNVGFRGQGDCPFWSHDSSGQFNTPEKRGALISSLIQQQCALVKKYIRQPVFCTNLYGETMELYAEGHIQLPPDVIKISADNGYGKMVTRRRDNHTVRISSLPERPEQHCGIYYHVSFYDLQAANHIVRLPNSVDFVNRELDTVIEKNAVEYWLINCSNVRPHVYCLDAIRKKWYGQPIAESTHSKQFTHDYYPVAPQEERPFLPEDGFSPSNPAQAAIAKCLESYPQAMLAYGQAEDEHAGEQFYNENLRILAHQFLLNQSSPAQELNWLTGEQPSLCAQARYIGEILHRGQGKLSAYYDECLCVSGRLQGKTKQLFNATVLLQAEIHAYCVGGFLRFLDGLEAFAQCRYREAFMQWGQGAEMYQKADASMRGAEYGVWQGFYFNECFADVKHSAYMVKKAMGIAREYGDNARHDEWYREAVYSIEDRKVMTLLVNDNHMTDWEIYEAFKKKEEQGL